MQKIIFKLKTEKKNNKLQGKGNIANEIMQFLIPIHLLRINFLEEAT